MLCSLNVAIPFIRLQYNLGEMLFAHLGRFLGGKGCRRVGGGPGVRVDGHGSSSC